jgi:hypothetical protein
MTALGTRFRFERDGPGEFTPKRVQDLNDPAECVRRSILLTDYGDEE